jgi:HAMP domain-containing protein
VSVGVTLPIVGIIGFLMTYPVVRRLKALELAATRIAADDLQARAPALARSRAI